jgi:putative polyketide hydroxylase
VPQDHLEPVLLRHLETFGLAEVRFGTVLVDLDQDADGAHSRTRELLGIAMDGPDHLNEQLTVLFEAPLRGVVGDRRYGIYFIQHPEAGGVLVPNGRDDRWLYGRGWDPEHERLDDYTDTRPWTAAPADPRAELAEALSGWSVEALADARGR